MWHYLEQPSGELGSLLVRQRPLLNKHHSQPTVHFYSTGRDGKLLPDIASGTKVVDRIAILVTGEDIEQLLAVPKIGRGTGMEQCNACLSTLTDWELKPFFQRLIFDTTPSNTA